MPSIRKNLHKFVRNLSNPHIESEHHKKGEFLRRTICTTESVENQQQQSRPASGALGLVVDHDEDDEENASFILRYLRGDIHRIHPRVSADRTGDFAEVHILARLDADVRLSHTGPDEGISLIPYLGSRRIYDKFDGSDYYANFPLEQEEKMRQLPAMIRATLFAKSGQQCYLPRNEFRRLVNRDAKVDGTRNRTAVSTANGPAVTIENVVPISATNPVLQNGFLSGRLSVPNSGTMVTKSGSLVSMTHIGQAPYAKIDEILEEEDMEMDVCLPVQTVSESAPVVEIIVENGLSETLEKKAEVEAAVGGLTIPNRAEAKSGSVSGSGTESGDDMVTDSFAEVVPVPVPVPVVRPGPVFSKQTKRRLSKTIRDRASRSIHQQLLEDFPFTLQSDVHWDQNGHDRACGVSTTLYERNPTTSLVAGTPVADVFAICARENNAILAIADGVNWGEKARLAAQCAVRGAVDCLQAVVFQDHRSFRTTKDVFSVLLDSVHAAHNLILQEHGALSTICVALVCPLQEARRYVACVCNVGDSFAYVYSRKFGVREITGGSHNIQNMRDMRDALGALGPVDGCNPELSNIMCSMTLVDPDDIVFLTTDGISDNFDPVIGKFCLADTENSILKQIKENVQVPTENGVADPKDPAKVRFEDNNVPVTLNLPKVTASQRHELTLLRMEDLIRNGITIGDKPCTTAREVCQCFLNFAVQLTSAKRHVLEDPDLYPADTGEKQSKTKQRHDRRRACERLALMPGKLDHATLVAYQVGEWHDPPAPTEQQSGDLTSGKPSAVVTPEPTSMDQMKDFVAVPKTRKVSHAFPLIDSPEVMRQSVMVNGDDDTEEDLHHVHLTGDMLNGEV